MSDEKKARRKFTLSAQARDDLQFKADDLAASLAAGDLTKGEASDLVATVIGEALEMTAKLAGAPNAGAELVGAMAEKIAKAIGEALKPDPKRLMAKATEAMKAGNWDKARRLMDKAERVQKRQAEAG
jgi:hypothetical protein